MVTGLNFLVAFLSPIVFEKFSQRTCLIYGSVVACIANASIVVFNEYNLNVLILIAILSFVVGFEVSVGPGYFVHVQETTIDSILGLSNMTMSFFVISCNIITPLLVENTGARGTFSFCTACCLVSLAHLFCILKDTTYRADGKTKLTEREKKELYMPEEYKSK